MPELVYLAGIEQNPNYHHKNVLEHTLLVVEHCPATPMMRWAGLLHDIGKPLTFIVTNTGIHFYNHEDLGSKMANDIAIRLRFSTSDRMLLTQLIQYHMRPNLYNSKWGDEAIRRLKRECGSFLSELLALSRADCTSMRVDKIEAAIASINELEQRLAKEPEPLNKCPLNGHDIIYVLNIDEGPLVGRIQKYIMKKIEAGDVKPDNYEALWDLAKKKLEELENEGLS